MSDIGLFPPGALVWLASAAWCCLCLVTLAIFLLIAWLRTKDGKGAFSRDRFFGYAIGALLSGVVAGVTTLLINWSGSLGAFARWLDRPAVSGLWLAMTVASAFAAGFAWNRSRRLRR